MPKHNRPEERLAADLGLTVGDLYRLARHERAKKLVGRMERVVRDAAQMVRGELLGYEIEAMGHEAREILAELDAPIAQRRTA